MRANHGRRPSNFQVIWDRQLAKAGVMAMTRARVRQPPRHWHAGGGHQSQSVPVHMADGVGSRSHRRSPIPRQASCGGIGHGVLAHSPGGASHRTARALPSSATRPGGGGRALVKLLLVSKQQVPSGKTSGALRTGKRFLLGMGAFVALQMLQSRKGSRTCPAHMRSRLVGLGRREGCGAGVNGGRLRIRSGGWHMAGVSKLRLQPSTSAPSSPMARNGHLSAHQARRRTCLMTSKATGHRRQVPNRKHHRIPTAIESVKIALGIQSHMCFGWSPYGRRSFGS